MTDREALYEAVLAAPDNDLPRLVLADWFEENGDALRGIYIRTQIEQSRVLHNNEWGDESVAIPEATEAVLEVPAESIWEWAGAYGLPAPKPTNLLVRNQVGDLDLVHDIDSDMTYGFRRGFIEEVRCRAIVWQEKGRAIACRIPIRRVQITDKRPHGRARDEWVWRVSADRSGDLASILPVKLFAALSGGAYLNPGHFSFDAVYLTRQAAIEALSTACLAYARGE
ncbi:TIGR02996 domain-containing protein [Fimbriiglobus ruber]|uniref:TIGR02996 domain-containing protein n=1 Tax=Fimbriiglobus ruber TaxID=1908690 RepID=A0A225E0T2_9BACT|nr:TIGR02996 domain-containing protein [Fimbriiglobus ruber]OWK47201.1 hypothetical protein FRUB_00900 [Fimbriiglobus ruber]